MVAYVNWNQWLTHTDRQTHRLHSTAITYKKLSYFIVKKVHNDDNNDDNNNDTQPLWTKIRNKNEIMISLN